MYDAKNSPVERSVHISSGSFGHHGNFVFDANFNHRGEEFACLCVCVCVCACVCACVCVCMCVLLHPAVCSD